MAARVKMEHARRLGFCAHGVRDVCQRLGIDYADFIINGIDSEVLSLVAGDNAQVRAVIEEAERSDG